MEQTITARIELKYNLSAVFKTWYTEWVGFGYTMNELERYFRRLRRTDSDATLIDMIDSSILRVADNVTIARFGIFKDPATKKRIVNLAVDVTYIRPGIAPWRFNEDEIPYLKDPVAFTNEALPTLDKTFAIDAFDIKASRVKFFI